MFVQVHPHRREHDGVESLTPCGHNCEVWQAVIKPLNPRRDMQLHRAYAQRCRRLNGRHDVTHGSEASSVTPCSSPNVEYASGRLREEVQDMLVHVGK